jgi:hypothetical protein
LTLETFGLVLAVHIYDDARWDNRCVRLAAPGARRSHGRAGVTDRLNRLLIECRILALNLRSVPPFLVKNPATN